MQLRLVATVDFRCGVPFHVETLKRLDKWPDLGEREVVLLVSLTGLQLAFVFPRIDFETVQRGEMHAIQHLRVQLDKRTPWDPAMLKEYAYAAGISLAGIRRFEDFLSTAS